MVIKTMSISNMSMTRFMPKNDRVKFVEDIHICIDIYYTFLLERRVFYEIGGADKGGSNKDHLRVLG